VIKIILYEIPHVTVIPFLLYILFVSSLYFTSKAIFFSPLIFHFLLVSYSYVFTLFFSNNQHHLYQQLCISLLDVYKEIITKLKTNSFYAPSASSSDGKKRKEKKYVLIRFSHVLDIFPFYRVSTYLRCISHI
jgi:hypothetical protein